LTNLDDSGWFVAGITSVVAALASAVAMLFKMLESKNTEAIVRLSNHVKALEDALKVSDSKHDECQKDRAVLSIKVAMLEDRFEAMKNER
jgi:hypothetical protein